MSHLTSKSTAIPIGETFTFRTRYQSISSANTALQAYAKGIKDRDEWVYEGKKSFI